MNILLLNYEFPPLGGGAGNATANLARQLTLLGHRVCVLTSAFDNLPKEENYQGFKIYRVWTCRSKKYQGNIFEMLLYVIAAVVAAPRVLSKEGRPDKVISFFSIPSGLVAYWLKKKYNLKYILSLRGGDVPGFYSRALKFYHFLTLPLNKKIWQQAEYIVANSQSLRDLAQKTAAPLGQNIKIIPNGVDTDMFQPLFDKDNKKFTLIFAGRLCPQKGAAELISAIRELSLNKAPTTSNLYCKIAGRGPSEKELKKMVVDFKLKETIAFVGWLDKENLLREYRSADVFILPSTDEGMSNAILEAMASGLVIIAKNMPANRELIVSEVSGLLYDNASELPLMISRLMTDHALKDQLSSAARARALKFSWRHVAEMYEQLLIS